MQYKILLYCSRIQHPRGLRRLRRELPPALGSEHNSACSPALHNGYMYYIYIHIIANVMRSRSPVAGALVGSGSVVVAGVHVLDALAHES